MTQSAVAEGLLLLMWLWPLPQIPRTIVGKASEAQDAQSDSPSKRPRDSRRSTDPPSRLRYSSSPRRRCPKSPIQTGPPVAPLRRLCLGAFLGEPAGRGFIAASSGQRVGQLRDFITWVTEMARAGSPRAGATRTGRRRQRRLLLGSVVQSQY